jgi:hypothetical protein
MRRRVGAGKTELYERAFPDLSRDVLTRAQLTGPLAETLARSPRRVWPGNKKPPERGVSLSG